MFTLRSKLGNPAFCNAALFCNPSIPRTFIQSNCSTRITAAPPSIRIFQSARQWGVPAECVFRFQKPPIGNSGGFGSGSSGGGFGRGGWGRGSGDGDGDGGEGGPLKRLVALYVGALVSRPVLTKATSTLVLGLAGDYCAQQLTSAQKKEEFCLDLRRLLSVGAWSFCCTGPALHYWYAALDRVFFGRFAALYKVISDQVFFAPAFNTTFIVGVGAFEGTSLSELRENLSSRFWPSMKANWTLWPAAQVINFSVVPKTWQILYVNCVGFVWNIILTYIAHSDTISTGNDGTHAIVS